MTKAEHFHAIGVSYKTADIDQRGQFSLNDTQLHALFLDAKDSGVTDFLVINTCNRTELYSWTAKHETLVNLLRGEINKYLTILDILTVIGMLFFIFLE